MERQDLVRGLLVWLELERQNLVGPDVERELVVGQDLERAHVVGPDVERIRLVGRLVGRGRRSIGPLLGCLGQHHLGGLDAPPLAWPS